ncbi:hypothetical protein [Shewanella dokdonensis]|uniref:DUF1461 domain-containing protein n=1 Tax=Shewanella dokdonensis TaxID=712036 RepID=A0ABX8DH53_9GAMM|nr:hypothetical protein [Shewanella dokdonensis]MCL1074321.1 hypothetical protein [Shewanella dokdonensis]QVK24013.1 hypothetical protein KHX94_05140 [Shewanella dokdonensis]
MAHLSSDPSVVRRSKNRILIHLLHFVLTMLTLGLWGPLWWLYANRCSVQEEGFFHRFDNDYWDYIVERDEPPAALHPIRFDLVDEIRFDA